MTKSLIFCIRYTPYRNSFKMSHRINNHTNYKYVKR